MQDAGRLGQTDGSRERRGEVGVGLGRYHGKWGVPVLSAPVLSSDIIRPFHR